MKNYLIPFGYCFLLFVIFNNPVLAHPGRTNSSGCHTCRTNCAKWGLSAGEYHCHGGLPNVRPSDPAPTPIPFTLPEVQAAITKDYNASTKTYQVTIDWSDVPTSDGYSIAISNQAGANPGPLVDTTASKWTFKKVSSGTWYVNLKAKKGNTWSNITHWEVVIPQKTAAVGFLKPQPKGSSPPKHDQKPSYTCNCAKTCSQLSCAEAQFQLNQCGCTKRDGDGDGKACDSQC